MLSAIRTLAHDSQGFHVCRNTFMNHFQSYHHKKVLDSGIKQREKKERDSCAIFSRCALMACKKNKGKDTTCVCVKIKAQFTLGTYNGSALIAILKRCWTVIFFFHSHYRVYLHEKRGRVDNSYGEALFSSHHRTKCGIKHLSREAERKISCLKAIKTPYGIIICLSMP